MTLKAILKVVQCEGSLQDNSAGALSAVEGSLKRVLKKKLERVLVGLKEQKGRTRSQQRRLYINTESDAIRFGSPRRYKDN